MALAQLIIQAPGGLIKSGDWNGEFQNILTNPIALISPTTGAINFNLTAHTNLVISALSATSGSTGNVLTISSGGSPIWTSTGIGTGGKTVAAMSIYNQSFGA